MGRKSKANGGVVADDQNEEEDKNQFDQTGKYLNDIDNQQLTVFLI